MRFDEIQPLNESLHAVVRDLCERASKELFQYEYAFDRRGGMTVWTRGDGSRYRDPKRIVFDNRDAKDAIESDHKYVSKESEAKWKPIWEKMAATKSEDAIDQFWNWLQQQPNVKAPNFRVSGEFGSSKYRDVLVLGPYIFINDRTEIQYGTKSLLRNSSIWRVEKN